MKCPRPSWSRSAGRQLCVVVGLITTSVVLAFGDTRVAGGVSGTWTLGKSPYVVTGDLLVPIGRTLVIEPGVVVKFDTTGGVGGFSESLYGGTSGKVDLNVQGTLLAVGTPEHPIVFTSNLPTPAPGDYQGIFFDGVNTRSGGTLRFCQITFAQIGVVCFSTHNVIIDQCVITDNQGDGLQARDAPDAIRVTNSLIRGNGGRGIGCLGVSPQITGNRILQNGSNGIALNYLVASIIQENTIEGNGASGIWLNAAAVSPRFRYNNISGNAGGGLWNGQSEGISWVMADAVSNWWGSATGPKAPQNPTGRGDQVGESVAYAPWLSYPAAMGESVSFRASADSDGVVEQRIGRAASVDIPIFARHATDLGGFIVTIRFDPRHLSFEAFREDWAGQVNFLKTAAGATFFPPPVVANATVEVDGAVLNPSSMTAPDGDGLLGVLTFRVLGAFADETETDLTITEGVKVGLRTDDLSAFVADSVCRLKPLPMLQSDFNNDGQVDILDFFGFCTAYGTRAGNPAYETKYDLDGDGKVGFIDFFTFAGDFGKRASY